MNRLFPMVLAILLGLAGQAAPPTRLPLGAKAPDFDLPGVDGKRYQLSDFKDAKVLTLVFTCNHCPTAQYYEERIKAIARDYRDRGVALVAISPNDPQAVRLDELGYTDLGDSFAEMKVRAKNSQFDFPYLFGAEEYEATSKAYGPAATPHAFVFDQARKLRYAGRIDDSERIEFVQKHDLREALDALLAGREPEPGETKVFGCSVKWSDKRAGVADYWKRIREEPVAVELVDAEGLRRLRTNRAEANEGAKLRLVNFWATWCGPCVTEFPDLMTIDRMYRGRDFELVTVAAHYPDEKPTVLGFLKRQHASNRNLMFGRTDKYPLMDAFDAKWNGALPYTVLIHPSGKVLYRKQGSFDALELKRLIVKELNEIKPW